MPAKALTIGVFDSGFGGLTVLRELLPLIPGARYIYLGDTARLPYGSKSHETIARYAVSSARYLHEQGADLLVIACNTATALAFDDIRQAMPIPVIGVIQPGAKAALAASQGDVLVLATQATIQSHAYAQALHALGLQATEKACPLLVPLVEEGWTNHPVTDEVIKIYLTEALTETPAAETLLLGCTHYPLLEPAIARVLAKLGHPLTIIDSAHATAKAVTTYLHQHQHDLSFRPEAALLAAGAEKPASLPQNPACTFYATDSIEKFQRLGSNFLGQPLSKVHLLDLGG